jgi:ketosteroid isomerase-like protein
MNANEELITKFYNAFDNNDVNQMASCYHKDIQFQDPAFGVLKENEPITMWKMLLERSKGQIKIDFNHVIANKDSGSATWIATYTFSQTGRKVVNTIQATFEFKDGLISNHIDYFDLWKWSRQALGLKGLLLGWTGFMQNKIKESAQKSLQNYMTEN